MIINFIVIVLAVITIYTDGRYRKIYNKVLLPCILVAFITHLIIGGLTGLERSVFGATLGAITLMSPYLLGSIGAGDVKLLIVFGALLGPMLFITAFIYGAIMGGFISLYKLLKKEKTLTYGIPLSIGALITLLYYIHC